MKKEEKPIFLKILVITGIIFLINLGMFFYRYINRSLTGLTIKESIYEAYRIPPTSKIFLAAQWVLLISALFLVYINDKRVKIKKNEFEGINLKKMSKKQGTDIDTFYNVLQNKKQLRISTIAKLFGIDKEIVMEWGKILESGNLAFIDYPTAREPVIKIVEN